MGPCVHFNKVVPCAPSPLVPLAGNEVIPESAFCGMLESGQNGFPIWEVSTCVFFIIPMTVILVLYVRIGMRIRERTKHTQALGESKEVEAIFFIIKRRPLLWRHL